MGGGENSGITFFLQMRQVSDTDLIDYAKMSLKRGRRSNYYKTYGQSKEKHKITFFKSLSDDELRKIDVRTLPKR